MRSLGSFLNYFRVDEKGLFVIIAISKKPRDRNTQAISQKLALDIGYSTKANFNFRYPIAADTSLKL